MKIWLINTCNLVRSCQGPQHLPSWSATKFIDLLCRIMLWSLISLAFLMSWKMIRLKEYLPEPFRWLVNTFFVCHNLCPFFFELYNTYDCCTWYRAKSMVYVCVIDMANVISYGKWSMLMIYGLLWGWWNMVYFLLWVCRQLL